MPGGGHAPILPCRATAHVLKKLDQASSNSRLLGPEPRNLSRAKLQVVRKIRERNRHTHRAMVVTMQPVIQSSVSQHAEDLRQVVHGLGCGVGGVDWRRQGPVADIHQAADAEGDILQHGPCESDLDRVSNCLLQPKLRWHMIGRRVPDVSYRSPGDNVVTHRLDEPDDQVISCRNLDKRFIRDLLNVAGAIGRQSNGPCGWGVWTALLGFRVAGLVRVEVVDDLQGLTHDHAHNRVDLNRGGKVVDEVDEHTQLASANPSDPETARRGMNAATSGFWTPTVCKPAVL